MGWWKIDSVEKGQVVDTGRPGCPEDDSVVPGTEHLPVPLPIRLVGEEEANLEALRAGTEAADLYVTQHGKEASLDAARRTLAGEATDLDEPAARVIAMLLGPVEFANAVPGRDTPDDLYNGDGPADMMGVALRQIDKLYQEAWGRDAKPDELRACFNFVLNGRLWAAGVEV